MPAGSSIDLGEPLYLCARCDSVTPASSIPCVNCWEVEHRLDQYLRAEKGRALIRAKLDAFELRAIPVGSSPDGIAAALQRYCDSE